MATTVYDLYNGFPQRWIQGHMAETASGLKCTAQEERACKWCFSGALFYVYSTAGISVPLLKVHMLCVEAGYTGVCGWNDAPERKFEDILAMAKLAGV